MQICFIWLSFHQGEHIRGPACSAHVYEDYGGGMSKQTTADVPGVLEAPTGVSVGDAGSAGGAKGCAGDASGFAVSAFVMAGPETGD